jgi:putative DNA primase/helicase
MKLRKEHPAIFRWIIDGYSDWAKQSLNPPESLRDETEEYLFDQDALRSWMDERLVLDSEASVSTREEFDDWKTWTTERNLYTGTINDFSLGLRDQGLKYHRDADFRGFKGCRLRYMFDPKKHDDHGRQRMA